MKTIDITQLATVVGGIVEGGCVVPDPWLTGMMERIRNAKFPKLPDVGKTPLPKGQPADLGSIGTTRPK